MTELEVAIARGTRAGARFRSPAPFAQLAELERRVGGRLQEDLHAFYALHDGVDGIGVAGHEDLLSVAEAGDAWSMLREVWSELEPHQGLWSDLWLPVTSDGGGSHLCVDLAADRLGTVIRYWHVDPDRPRVADSFTKWLATVDWTVDSGD
jgi:cell wall assembly regulator SMI1